MGEAEDFADAFGAGMDRCQSGGGAVAAERCDKCGRD